MATQSDCTKMQRAMEIAKYEKNQQWVGQIAITYSESMDKYLARFDADLTIVFDKVHYSSNSLHFYVYTPRGEIEIGFLTHRGLHDYGE